MIYIFKIYGNMRRSNNINIFIYKLNLFSINKYIFNLSLLQTKEVL